MGYNRFMEIGVENQKGSVTVDEATRNYARSCECCIKKGNNFNFDCDCDCPITIAHREKIEAILTLRQLEHEREIRKEIQKKLDECIKMIEDIYEMMYSPSQLDEHNGELDKITDKWIQLKGGKLNV